MVTDEVTTLEVATLDAATLLDVATVDAAATLDVATLHVTTLEVHFRHRQTDRQMDTDIIA